MTRSGDSSRDVWSSLSRSPDDTFELGRVLGRNLPRSSVVSLNGTLGAGKTILAKGIVSEAAGVPRDSVTSPAYSLVNEHGSPMAVAHMDFYRLDRLDEADAEVLEEYFGRSDILVVVEWGGDAIQSFTSRYLEIVLDFIDSDDDSRSVEIRAHGPASGEWLPLDSLAELSW